MVTHLNHLLLCSDLVVAFTIAMMYLAIKKTRANMWIAVPITNQNPGKFYHDLNELLAKNDMPKLKITGHMPPELNPTRLTVVLAAHTPNSNLDSSIVRHNSVSSINSFTTDLGTAETRPLDNARISPLQLMRPLSHKPCYYSSRGFRSSTACVAR